MVRKVARDSFNTVEPDNDGAYGNKHARARRRHVVVLAGLSIVVDGQMVRSLPLLVQALKRLRDPLSPKEISGLSIGGKVYVDLPDGRALALPLCLKKHFWRLWLRLYDQPLNPDGSLTVPA